MKVFPAKNIVLCFAEIIAVGGERCNETCLCLVINLALAHVPPRTAINWGKMSKDRNWTPSIETEICTSEREAPDLRTLVEYCQAKASGENYYLGEQMGKCRWRVYMTMVPNRRASTVVCN